MTQTPSRHTQENLQTSESEHTCFVWHKWIQMAAQTLIPEDFMCNFFERCLHFGIFCLQTKTSIFRVVKDEKLTAKPHSP